MARLCSAWMLFSFSPFPVGHPAHEHSTIVFIVRISLKCGFLIISVKHHNNDKKGAEKISRDGDVDLLTSHSLSTDLTHLKNTGEDLTDFTIICQDKKFPVHKQILAARSDVFLRMFQHEDTQEAKNNQIEMDDTDPETVERFLE